MEEKEIKRIKEESKKIFLIIFIGVLIFFSILIEYGLL